MDVIQGGASGLTVEAYAARKCFDPARLRRWGVCTARNPHTGHDCVALPYYDLAGRRARTKYRTSTSTYWDAQQGRPLLLYGLWWLAKISAARPVILVEGESDCHAGWTHRLLVLGLPGANTWKPEWARLLGLRTVYVWREPVLSGKTVDSGRMMMEAIAADLPQAKVIQPAGVKDLAELHLRAGESFGAELWALRAAAKPIHAVVDLKARSTPEVRFKQAPPKPRSLFLPQRTRTDRRQLEVEKAHAVPLDQLLERLGFELKRRGHEWVTCCPFHEDTRPSLRVNPAKGTWYCDPCGSGGDAIAFLMRWRGLRFPDAVRAVVS